MIDRVLIEITRRCNLNCEFCYNSSGKKETEEMNTEDVYEIIRKSHKCGAREIIISGGEPCLHPSFSSIVNFCMRQGPKTTIVSNGMELKEEIVLLNKDEIWLQLSLDGASEMTDDKIRGKGHYRKCVNLMEKMHDNKYENGIIRMTISKENINDIEEYYKIAKKYNFIPSFSFISRSGRAKVNWNEILLSNEEKWNVIEQIKNLHKEYESYFRIRNKEYMHGIKNIIPSKGCDLLENDLFSPLIKTDGSVQPCQRLYDSSFTIGNIFADDLEFILSNHNIKMKELIEKINKRNNILEEKCRPCIMHEICKKGCLGESIDNGGFNHLPNDCFARKKEFSKNIFLEVVKDDFY